MKKYNTILTKNLQKLALSASKNHKYELLLSEEILPSDQSKVIEQAKFTYYCLGKKFEKQIKTIECLEIKQVQALKSLKREDNQELESIEWIFPKKMRNYKIKNEDIYIYIYICYSPLTDF